MGHAWSEDRAAEKGRVWIGGVPSPMGEGYGRGIQKMIWDLKTSAWALFIAVQLPVVHAKKH